jgi:hypothetical protein
MRHCANGVLLLLLATRALPAQDVTLAVVLDRLHQYLRDYARVVPATIAIERYTQRVGRYERVELESEFGIVRVPNNPQWVGFRDVMKVKAIQHRSAPPKHQRPRTGSGAARRAQCPSDANSEDQRDNL